MTSPLLQCRQLSVTVPDRVLVRDLSLELAPGQTVCVLGPNGVGKTLTLHTLAGLRPAPHGCVQLAGKSLDNLPRLAVARRIGLLLQDDGDRFPALVHEAVLMGRFPYMSAFARESADDRAAVTAALEFVGLAGFESRLVTTLSGGERRRLTLARLLTQDPAVMLLDEPVNHLDPRHQVRILARLQDLAVQGKAVMFSLHDPALAARVACTVLLLFGDGSWLLGPADDVINAPNLERLFGTEYQRYDSDGAISVLLPRMPRRSAGPVSH
jgi:iron complex transport system ATP-binding protein